MSPGLGARNVPAASGSVARRIKLGPGLDQGGGRASGYSFRAAVADSATAVPAGHTVRAWQVVFQGTFTISAGHWVDVGPTLPIMTSGGPLMIVIDVYAHSDSHSTFQPLVDGVWAGSYSGMPGGDPFWKEGLLFTGGGSNYHQWNKAKIYPGIPAGSHTVSIQGATDGGTMTVGGSSTIGMSLQVIELDQYQ